MLLLFTGCLVVDTITTGLYSHQWNFTWLFEDSIYSADKCSNTKTSIRLSFTGDYLGGVNLLFIAVCARLKVFKQVDEKLTILKREKVKRVYKFSMVYHKMRALSSCT